MFSPNGEPELTSFPLSSTQTIPLSHDCKRIQTNSPTEPMSSIHARYGLSSVPMAVAAFVDFWLISNSNATTLSKLKLRQEHTRDHSKLNSVQGYSAISLFLCKVVISFIFLPGFMSIMQDLK